MQTKHRKHKQKATVNSEQHPSDMHPDIPSKITEGILTAVIARADAGMPHTRHYWIMNYRVKLIAKCRAIIVLRQKVAAIAVSNDIITKAAATAKLWHISKSCTDCNGESRRYVRGTKVHDDGTKREVVYVLHRDDDGTIRESFCSKSAFAKHYNTEF